MKLKMRLEYSDKTSLFEVKLFFQRPLENFLCTFIQCSRYLEGPPNIAFCVRKKIGTIRHTDKNISAKNSKKLLFWRTSFDTTVGSFLRPSKTYKLFFQLQKKVGETDPIVKSSELSNMFPLKSGQKKFGTDSSRVTFSFWDLKVERGNA